LFAVALGVFCWREVDLQVLARGLHASAPATSSLSSSLLVMCCFCFTFFLYIFMGILFYVYSLCSL
jgi:hypothetical protein